jgi:hypothetical protein
LTGLDRTKDRDRGIEQWMDTWKRKPEPITPTWYLEDAPKFQVFQYDGLTENQLLAKVAQLPRGTPLGWQFWPPGQISAAVTMARQEAVYERVRAAAARNGIVLEQINHP